MAAANKPDQPASPDSKADHLCVLVHGLWGNASHMNTIASTLRARYDETKLHIIASKCNKGNLTYDGIEVCGERLAHEIENTLDKFKADGQAIKKLSVVGYSLGGLISRYALGLLYARGYMDDIQPMNYTTFATPHLGARAPVRGAASLLFNGLGSRTVSSSGRQMFLTDEFRDTGKPLLSVLADPENIFVEALKRFRYRAVYGNVVNDRTTPFYTTIFSGVDHFPDLEGMNINYCDGYQRVIVDPDVYTLPAKEREKLPFLTRIKQGIQKFFRKIPFWFLYALMLFIALPLFLVYAVIQTFRSRKRIRLHEEGSGDLFSRYRVPVAVKRVQSALDEVIETAAAQQEPDYISSSSPSDLESQSSSPTRAATPENNIPSTKIPDESSDDADNMKTTTIGSEKRPTLALTPDQFSMIKSLDAVGFRKYPVYIHNHHHTHAAIVVRVDKPGFEEGHVVIKHWLDRGFRL